MLLEVLKLINQLNTFLFRLSLSFLQHLLTVHNVVVLVLGQVLHLLLVPLSSFLHVLLAALEYLWELRQTLEFLSIIIFLNDLL